MTKDAFAGYHPFVSLIYFTVVIGAGMMLMHPVCQVMSIISGILYLYRLEGTKAAAFTLKFALPMMLLAAIVNPAFTHEGVTILAYLPTGNPLTLESMLYGLSAGAMLAGVMLWFNCFSKVMTSDKFVYLFGRIIPSLSLVLSMTLRFVPRFAVQFELVRQAQAGVGNDTSSGSLWSRLKSAIRCFSIMVTWSFENAIETADSMRGRGYGMPGRTAFSIYKMEERDVYMLIWSVFAGLFLIAGAKSRGLFFQFYPNIKISFGGPWPVAFFLLYGAICATPVVVNLRNDRVWKRMIV